MNKKNYVKNLIISIIDINLTILTRSPKIKKIITNGLFNEIWRTKFCRKLYYQQLVLILIQKNLVQFKTLQLKYFCRQTKKKNEDVLIEEDLKSSIIKLNPQIKARKKGR